MKKSCVTRCTTLIAYVVLCVVVRVGVFVALGDLKRRMALKRLQHETIIPIQYCLIILGTVRFTRMFVKREEIQIGLRRSTSVKVVASSFYENIQ